MQERVERHLRLQSCQRCANAVVVPQAESEVPILSAPDIEAVGIGEPLRVAIGSRDKREDDRARPKLHSRELHRFYHSAVGELHGRLEAQALLHGAWEEREIVLEPFAFSGVLEQEEDGVPDEVRRRLVSCSEEQRGQGDELALGEGVPLLIGFAHRREEVVARGPAAFG